MVEKVTDIQATVAKEELVGDGAVVKRGKKEIQKSCSKIINIKLYLIRYIIKRSERIISSLL